VKLAIILVTAVVTLAISVYGHATIVRMSGGFTIVLAGCVAVLGYFVVRHTDLQYVPVEAPHGTALWAAPLPG
jgi:nucleobase:cation symporter-1, NCS1 family